MSERNIFLEALDVPVGRQRDEYLDNACGGDARLRAQVNRLLQAHEAAHNFLEVAPPEVQAVEGLDGLASDYARGGGVPLDFLTPSADPNRLGTLGGYEIIEVLGQGGMGLVLRAFDIKLSRVVAIKVLAPELAANAMARQRFLREARAAAAITHPNVVTIYAVDETQRLPFIVMECVQGQTLQQKIDSVGALEIEEILRIGAQTAQGLAAAHAQGIVHRDVKPGNVLLENGIERVKLTDFGLARATDDVNITQTGLIAGTPQYMSPEQAEGRTIDQRSDLFSLGSVMYAMCTGRPAFRADSALAVLRRVCDDEPRPICDVNPVVPDWLTEIVDRLMAKAPSDRFQTAHEIARLLSDHLARLQRSTLAPRPMRLLPRQNGPKEAYAKPPRVTAGAYHSSLRPWVLSGLLAAGVVLVLLAGVVALKMVRGWRTAEAIPEAVPFVPQGKLLVEVDDPLVIVEVRGQGESHRNVAGRELSLPPGRYQVIARTGEAGEALNADAVLLDETVELHSNERLIWKRDFQLPTPPPELAIRKDVVELAESDVQRLTGWGPALSADGSHVACSVIEMKDDTNREVLVSIDIASGEQLVLAKQGKDPAWSPLPDGPIAFVFHGGAVEQIWLVEGNGRNLRKLVDGGFPSWSQDGKTLYYYHQPTGEVRAVAMDDPALVPRMIFKNPGTFYPAVSPDGSRMVVRKGNNGGLLAVVDLASGRTTSTIATPGWDGLLPSWSPDGRYLGFGSYAVRDSQGLCILDVEAGEVRQVLEGPLTLPRWSADGKRIVVDHRRKKELMVIDTAKLGL